VFASFNRLFTCRRCGHDLIRVTRFLSCSVFFRCGANFLRSRATVGFWDVESSNPGLGVGVNSFAWPGSGTLRCSCRVLIGSGTLSRCTHGAASTPRALRGSAVGVPNHAAGRLRGLQVSAESVRDAFFALFQGGKSALLGGQVVVVLVHSQINSKRAHTESERCLSLGKTRERASVRSPPPGPATGDFHVGFGERGRAKEKENFFITCKYARKERPKLLPSEVYTLG
jgi:hypothetical protein